MQGLRVWPVGALGVCPTIAGYNTYDNRYKSLQWVRSAPGVRGASALQPQNCSWGRSSEAQLGITRTKVMLRCDDDRCRGRNGIAPGPPHRSRRAELPHRAPASGCDDKTLVRIGMLIPGWGSQWAMRRIILSQVMRFLWLRRFSDVHPEPYHLVVEALRGMACSGHSVVPVVTHQHAFKPSSIFREGSCMRLLSSIRISFSFAFIFLRLVLRSTQNFPFLVLPHMCVKPRKSKVSGFSSPRFCSSISSEPAELYQACLLRVKLQVERGKSFLSSAWNLRPSDLYWKPTTASSAPSERSITSPREFLCRQRSAQRSTRSARVRRPPDQVGSRAPLWRAFCLRVPLSLFQHPRLQPFPYMAHHAPVPHPMLNKLQQPGVVKRIKEPTDVRIEHPIDRTLFDAHGHRVQRVVRTAPRSEAIGKPQEVSFIDGVDHLHRRPLDDLVFQGRDADGSRSAIQRRDVHPLDGLGVVYAALVYPIVQVCQLFLRGYSRSPTATSRHRCPAQSSAPASGSSASGGRWLCDAAVR